MSFEFNVSDRSYRQDRHLNAFEQISLISVVSPLFAKIIETVSDGKPSKKKEKNVEIELVEVISDFLKDMSEEEFKSIRQKTLKTVQLHNGDTWANIYNEQADSMMFADIDGFDVLEIIVRVVAKELAPFLKKMQRTGLIGGIAVN